ncbi:VOC family protein [Alkalibacillus almallahensis]|uniref:VOC family protein n=1 Tax=Alkalibacillus almallahensis TaxID=1379154 RepID=UPI0014229464|nr:VOC family protein [Alkalibacillus almallahensis]NIK11387.1 catechol 2,3-dioxygenase [Alkalibacillus almallahensis]
MHFHQAPIAHVSHVDLKVTDLQRAIAFYKQILGFQVLNQEASTAQLTANGETALLTLHALDQPSEKSRRTAGLYHYAILLPARSDLADFIKHISAQNVPIGASDHLVSESIYFSDPDGNGIEVYADRDPSEWNWQNGQVDMAVDPIDAGEILKHASDSGWQGLPANTTMGHIHLHVAELNQTKQFYTDGLGMEVVCRLGDQALFIADGHYHHHIGINVWNGVGAPPTADDSPGLKSYTIQLGSDEQKQTVLKQLDNINADMTEENGEAVATDPSGNRIRLVV